MLQAAGWACGAGRFATAAQSPPGILHAAFRVPRLAGAPVSRFRRRGRGRGCGKAEIGKVESRNRKAEGAAVSGFFLPSPSSCPSRLIPISACSFPDFSFCLCFPPSGFRFQPFRVAAFCFVASRATCGGTAAGGNWFWSGTERNGLKPQVGAFSLVIG